MSKLYIKIFNRLFKVLKRTSSGRNILSYGLKSDELKKLKTIFTQLKITFETEAENQEMCVIDSGNPACNSRVRFEIGDSEYHIVNFNSRLIPEEYAINISHSLKSIGIGASSEFLGSRVKEQKERFVEKV